MKNRKSLVALKEGLKTLNEDQFYYRSWVHRYREIDGELCGTVCCAAGWIPKFAKELGFYWAKSGPRFVSLDLKYNGYEVNEMTLTRAFGLTSDEIQFIFYGGEIPKKYNYKSTNHARFGIEHFVTLRQVINRIDLVLHHNQDENENA